MTTSVGIGFDRIDGIRGETTGTGGSGGGGGSAAAPLYAIQFNNPLGTFAGDAGLTWVPGSGLTDTLHAAFGTHAAVGGLRFDPPVALGGQDFTHYDSVITANEHFTGAKSASIGVASVLGLAHASVNSKALTAYYAYPTVLADSTGPIQDLLGLDSSVNNHGSGNVVHLAGWDCITNHDGAGTVNDMGAGRLSANLFGSGGASLLYGIKTDPWCFGGPVDTLAGLYVISYGAGGYSNLTNAYGVWIGDFSGVASTLNYNILSQGKATTNTNGSFNVFEGGVFIGNNATAAPGKTLVASGKITEPGANFSGGGTTNTLSITQNNTHASNGIYTYANNIEAYADSNSTGQYYQFINISAYSEYHGSGRNWEQVGVYCNAQDLGSGRCDDLKGGIFFALSNNTSGVATPLVRGGVFDAQIHGGTVTVAAAGYFKNDLTAGTVITAAGGYFARPATGSTITNNYGTYIEDQSGIGSAESLNIKSVVGGNLFTGHSAFGALGIVDFPEYPDSGSGTHQPTVINVSENFYGNLAALGEYAGVTTYIDFKNTGGGTSGLLAGNDTQININSGSTGPCGTVASILGSVFNNGSGNVSKLEGLDFIAEHDGSGTVAELNGVNMFAGIGGPTTVAAGGKFRLTVWATAPTVDCGRFEFKGASFGAPVVTDGAAMHSTMTIPGGTFTNLYGVKVDTPSKTGGTVTNHYGIFVADQSGIGGTISDNIRSKGSATKNVLEGWLQIQAAEKRVTTQFDKTSNTTLANITDLSVSVLAGRSYQFEAVLFTSSNVAGGVQAAIAGTATATAIIYEGELRDTNANAGQTRATALATAVAAVTAVTVARIEIKGLITVNAAGTLTVQFAQNASNGTASSVLVGSYFLVKDIA